MDKKPKIKVKKTGKETVFNKKGIPFTISYYSILIKKTKDSEWGNIESFVLRTIRDKIIKKRRRSHKKIIKKKKH